jgi:outer membrane protein OmpA-like peptidoglycan-associated protein
VRLAYIERSGALAMPQRPEIRPGMRNALCQGTMKITHTLLTTALTALLGAPGAMAEPDHAIGDQCELKFAFDSSALPRNATAELDHVVALSIARPDLLVVLDGHTDPVGTEVYNVGLSIRRAEAVRNDLVALGMDKDRIVIASYGKDGLARATHADDRRVTVRTTRESVASVIDHTFAGRGTSVNWHRPLTTSQLELPAADVVARR